MFYQLRVLLLQAAQAVEQAKEDAEIAKIKRRADRKIAREKREKDNKKQLMLNDIKTYMVDKGSLCVNGIASEILMDINGCYEKKPFLGAIGGQIQQWYYVLDAISELYADEDLKGFYAKMQKDSKNVKATTPRELIMEQFLVPFLILSIKELKETLRRKGVDISGCEQSSAPL